MGERLSFDAVIFDADGTLFDTETLMYEVWVEIGRDMGLSITIPEYLHYVGLNRKAVLDVMRERIGPDFDGADFMVRCVARLSERIEEEGVPLKPGVREILELLHQKGIPTGLATSTHRVRTNRRVELCGLREYFSAVVTGDEVSKGKPDPEIYRAVCGELSVSPEACLAVEDSRNGILSAHHAGLKVAMIPDMVPPTAELEEIAFLKLNSLLELRDYLQ